MANKLIKGLTIQLGAETTKLDKALKDAESRTRSACGELKQINNILRTNGDSAEMWRQKQEVLTKAIDASREKLKTLQTTQKSLADQLREGNIDKGAYDKFKQNVEKANEKLTKLKSEQADVEKKFQNGEIDKGEYEKFTRKVEAAEKQVKDLRIAENGLEESFRLGDISEEEYRAFRRDLEKTESDVRNFGNQLDEAKKKLDQTGDEAVDTADDVEELGDEAKKTSDGGITAMNVALGTLVAEGLKTAGRELKNFTKDVISTGTEFEATISKVGAISGASAEDIEKLREKASEMGATTKFTAEQSGEAFEYMAMAGWKTEDMLSGIKGILDLAAASGEELGTTSDIVTDALTAFGLQASDSSHFADVLAAASSNANTNVSMMGETFKYVAPVAGALNYNIEDMAESIGLLANNGIKSTQAGTALRSIITRLSTNAGASSKSLGALDVLTQELGVDFYDATGKARDFGDVIDEARVAWQGLSDSEQTDFGKKIAGQEALSGWLALMNSAPADVDKLSGAIQNCEGAASAMSETMQDNLQGDMTLLSSAVDGMKNRLYTIAEPKVREGVQFLTKQIPNIQDDLSDIFEVGSDIAGLLIKTAPTALKVVKNGIPIVAGMGTAFTTWKAANFIKTIPSLMSPANIAIAATGTALGLAYEAYKKFTKEREANKSETEKLIDKENEYQKELKETREKNEEMMQSALDDSYKIKAEADEAEGLWAELDHITDSRGKVLEGQETHAEYITNKLKDALGIEIDLVNGQIMGYDNLKNSIQSVIDKKKAEAYLSNYANEIADVSKSRTDTINDLNEKTKLRDELLSSLNPKAKSQFESMTGMSLDTEEGRKYYTETFAGSSHSTSEFDSYPELLSNSQLKDDLKLLYEYDQSISDSQSAIDAYNKSIDKYRRAEQAAYSGDYDTANSIFEADMDDDLQNFKYKSTTAEKKEALNNLMRTFKTYANEITRASENGMESAAKDMFSTTKTTFESMVKTAKEGGIKASTVWSAEFTETVEDLVSAGFDISGFAEWMREDGSVPVAEAFGDNFDEIVQKQLDSGFDVSELMRWAENSGYSFGDDFQKNYKGVVQKTIDNGFDATELLYWGRDKGWLTADEYASEFKSNVEQQLGNGFDATAFIDWWGHQGYLAASNFEQAYNSYMLSNLPVVQSINSASDARMYNDWSSGQRKYDIGKYATGGIISNAGTGRGIVAESGPELLEIINGGVRVTPLSRTSKLTPVGESNGNGQKVINFFNTINATVSGKYDVRRIAEDLAAEQRAIEYGMGKV